MVAIAIFRLVSAVELAISNRWSIIAKYWTLIPIGIFACLYLDLSFATVSLYADDSLAELTAIAICLVCFFVFVGYTARKKNYGKSVADWDFVERDALLVTCVLCVGWTVPVVSRLAINFLI